MSTHYYFLFLIQLRRRGKSVEEDREDDLAPAARDEWRPIYIFESHKGVQAPRHLRRARVARRLHVQGRKTIG